MALFFYKEKNKDIRAAAYLRLSIEDGDKAESNSIGNQRELIRDFAAERPGLHLVEEYADDGYTGTNFERPGFKRMMEDIKSGKINCIIVKDLSRLGRNYIEMGKYLEQIFPMMGIRFIAINDNYDNANTESSDSDSIVVPFKNLLNDSYCRDISIKVRSQLDMKRRKGEFIGGYAIYGYCKDKRNKNRLVVDEYAADIVRSIYRRKLEGMSAQAISEQLNSENIEDNGTDDISCNQYNYSTDYIYKDYLLPQEIGIITKGKGDSVQERMKSATIRFEKSCIEDKWKLKL